jgi:phosphomannomutase
MIGYYKAFGISAFEAVDNLKQKVGNFYNRLVNIEGHSFNDTKYFNKAMTKLRQNNITEFAGEKICLLEDFQTGTWYSEKGETGLILDRPNNKSVAKPIKHSNVIKIHLQSGAFIAFRPSGTEVKLKIYLQSCTTINFLDQMELEARSLLSL